MNARKGDVETVINSKLCSLISSPNREASNEYPVTNGWIDVMVRYRTYDVAIECRRHGSPRGKLEEDTHARLHPEEHASVGVAVIYPEGCSAKTLKRTTKLDVALVRKEHILNKKSNGDNPRWIKRNVTELIRLIDNMGRDLGNPDALVRSLNSTLESAVNILDKKETLKIGNTIDIESSQYKPAARRALLIVASAAMFHERLKDDINKIPEKKRESWQRRLKTLRECEESDDTVDELLRTWKIILQIDYKPIFQSGIDVLSLLETDRAGRAIRSIMRWSRRAVGCEGGLRHDILGRIFHKLLENARYDGSFYTSIPASIILAGLAIQKKSDISKKMKIIDPACGTGTLLMAAAERMMRIDPKYNARKMIEDVLVGVDINITALHVAATSLGLLSPTTLFKKMDIRKAELGILKGGGVATGSLELYGRSGTYPIHAWEGTQAVQVDSGKKRQALSYVGMADMVIMNPPFTRSDIRHDQLGKEAKKRVLEREAELFKSACITDRSSNGLMFLMLGDRLAKDDGTMAFVFPMSFVSAPSALGVRKFLAGKYHIEWIVITDDPDRFQFSENTNIAEILVVMRGGGGGTGNTKIVHLTENPNTATGADDAVRRIINNNLQGGSYIQTVPYSAIRDGDWSGTMFYSQSISDSFKKIRDGEMYDVVKLVDMAEIMPGGGRNMRTCFKTTEKDSRSVKQVIWNNRTGDMLSIEKEPDEMAIPKKGMTKQAKNTWAYAGHLIIPEKLQPNLTHVSAIHSTMPTAGSSWIPVVPTAPGIGANISDVHAVEWSQALSVFLNSTLGIITMLGMRVPKKPLYPRWTIDDQKNIPLPLIFSQYREHVCGIIDDAECAKNIGLLVKAYNKYACRKIGRFSDHQDAVRIKLDEVVCDVLGMKRSTVDALRKALAREPMCTGRRYMPR